MNPLTRAVGAPRRPLVHFLIGILAGFLEMGAAGSGPDGAPILGEGFASFFVPRVVFVCIVALGMAWQSGLPLPRLQFTAAWAIAAAFTHAVFSPVSAALAQMGMGAWLGVAVTAPGPLYPVPWAAALRGGAGACLGAMAGRFVAAWGAPAWVSPGFEILIFGIVMTQGHGERLVATVASEMEAIRRSGSEEFRRRADAIVNLAIAALAELDAVEEATGDDPAEQRATVGQQTRRALALIRRLPALPAGDEALAARVNAEVVASEKELEGVYRRELDRILHATHHT